MINLTEKYYNHVIELAKKYPVVLNEMVPETMMDDDIIADIICSIRVGDMDIVDYQNLCVYSRLLDISLSPGVEGVFILYEKDKEDFKNLLNN